MSQIILNISSNPILLVNQINRAFIEEAKQLQNRTTTAPAVLLRFREQFASNSSLVIARSFVDYLNSLGIYCSAQNLGSSYGYAQRLGFFSDFTGDEYNHKKHPPNGRFMEIELITSSDTQVSGKVSQYLQEYANRDDVFISDEALEILKYSVGELISNVRRHAAFTGRVSFQYYKWEGINELTVCDCGIGITESLRGGGYSGTDEQLLKESIKKNVTSSRVHPSYGEQSPGVGLYNICRLAEENRNAKISIATKNLLMTVSQEYPINNPGITYLDGYFPGTIVVARFPNNIHIDLRSVLSEHLKDTIPFFS
jgi:anti-sigma regulatory factor (Ser/Thr protein kinase)